MAKRTMTEKQLLDSIFGPHPKPESITFTWDYFKEMIEGIGDFHIDWDTETGEINIADNQNTYVVKVEP
jgi:hypothetical protein